MSQQENVSKKNVSIYIQAVIGMYIINIIHKIVREIPGSTVVEGNMGLIATTVCAIILMISIILVLLKYKLGIYLGFIPAVWATLQWILVHVILANPDRNGIWWYPIFPIIQGILIMYFSIIALKNDFTLKNLRKKASE
jgi:hypothetical protein